jgi:type II secretory pathway component PulC
MAADVKIDIAAEFTGKKAFRQAETATDKMSKNVKKLAGALGLAFGGQAILAYGKKAVKAAAEDEKAQKQLALALKNVGLGRDAASSEAYIQRLQSEFGILDDKLRPAYQTLAVATGNTAEAQRLLNLSLDIAASTGKDLGSVTSALSRAYLGNNAALSKLGVGISKADLKAGKFEDIIAQLEGTFKGAATQSANTFQGSIDKLGVAAANASEIIGTGLIDALKGLGDQDSVDNLAKSMQDVATYTADVIRGIGVLIEKLKGLPGIGALDIGMIPILGTYLEMLNAAGKASKSGNGISAQGLAHLAELQAKYAAATLATKKKLTAEEIKALKAAKLKAAIDKANLALNKGSDVFDMDKIQIAAALTNQAEQLGKATTSTQALQIANDTARLNVKQSILALEDAIASKDEAAIIAATNKLNADLKVLGALSGQSAKLTDIKSILESLKPADLINLANLDAAIAKMMELLKLQGTKTLVPTSPTAPSVNAPSGGGGGGGGASYASVAAKEAYDAVTYFAQKATDAFQSVEDSGAFNALVNMYAGGAINPFNAGSFREMEGGSLFSSGAVGSRDRDIKITINANTIANPDELTNLIQNSLITLNRRGDSLVQAGTL